jgi:hypothetical protein
MLEVVAEVGEVAEVRFRAEAAVFIILIRYAARASL